MLVHGAFADVTGFKAEIARVEADGYSVITPADPLRGLTFDSDYIRSLLASVNGPVVLVGHSYGGAVITNAARGADNVVALVYLAAFVPDEGDSVATSYDSNTYPGSLLTQQALVIRPTVNSSAPGGQDADLYIRSDLFRKIFAGDQSKQTAAVMAAAQRPLSASIAFFDPATRLRGPTSVAGTKCADMPRSGASIRRVGPSATSTGAPSLDVGG